MTVHPMCETCHNTATADEFIEHTPWCEHISELRELVTSLRNELDNVKADLRETIIRSYNGQY